MIYLIIQDYLLITYKLIARFFYQSVDIGNVFLFNKKIKIFWPTFIPKVYA